VCNNSGVADQAAVRKATRAVYIAFAGGGFAYASWASRIPQVRAELRVTPGTLGLILLCGAIGSGTATPLSGLVVGRIGEARAVAVMSLTSAAGLATIAVGYSRVAAVATGLFFFGFGTGAWDVAMNVQGAAVERGLGRAIMPKFHAGWSLGTVAGAGAGAAMVALGVPVTAHLLAVALAGAVVLAAWRIRALTPDGAVAAWIVGAAVFASGSWPFAAVLFAFFIDLSERGSRHEQFAANLKVRRDARLFQSFVRD